MNAGVDLPLAAALEAIGLPAELGARLALGGERGEPAPRLPVEEVGVACVGAALLAAARLQEMDGGGWPAPALDRGQLRAALISERLFTVGGERMVGGFAPQSRFWRAADGWVRTHANFAWHHEALLRALGAREDRDLAAAIAARPAAQVESDVFAAGGVAAAVRAPAAWREHPQGAAVAAEPLVERVRSGEAAPRARAAPADAPLLAGVRVLDLTRVIAGPVCSRYLGALGADVLRLDPPHLPDFEPGSAVDTLLAKRSAFLDLRTGTRRLEGLLAGADVVVLGYRPGSQARFGLDPEALATRHSGLVVLELAAWGHRGPWRGRRGFDSIVQAASGIAALEAGPDGEPGALPCQLLDHGSGYLAAAAVLAALAEQRQGGGSHLRRLSLARTAHWLLGAGRGGAAERPLPREGGAAIDRPRWHEERGAAADRLRRREGAPTADRPQWHEDGAAFVIPLADDPTLAAVPPPGSLAGAPLRWPGRAARYGADQPAWLGAADVC